MLNKVQFIGHLGRDPEERFLPDGKAVSNFPVASSEKWTDRNGEKQETTEWLRCTAFDRLAEVCNEYLVKGSLVYVEGKLKTRKWTDKDGIERYTTECVVREMKMLGSRPAHPGDARELEQRRPAPQKSQAESRQSTGFDDMDDDIPY